MATVVCQVGIRSISGDCVVPRYNDTQMGSRRRRSLLSGVDGPSGKMQGQQGVPMMNQSSGMDWRIPF